MKAKLFVLTLVLALSAALQPPPSQAAPDSCLPFCAIVRCISGYVCGPYVNSSGQTVCGCHPPRF